MSHISTYPIKIKKINALKSACDKLGLKYTEGQHICKQWGRNEIDCIFSFNPGGWKFDIAVTEDGGVHYDHYGSPSETMANLGKALQQANVNAIEDECWAKGLDVMSHYNEGTGETVLLVEGF